MKKCLLLLLLALSLLKTNAQDKTVKGKITDEAGKPLSGATVTVKGTNVSASTDENGNFQINTGNVLNPVLTVSYIGYESFDYSYKGNSGFTVRLHQDARTLGDVIVIGYGVQRKRDVTGATTEVKAEQIVKKPVVRGRGSAARHRPRRNRPKRQRYARPGPRRPHPGYRFHQQ